MGLKESGFPPGSDRKCISDPGGHAEKMSAFGSGYIQSVFLFIQGCIELNFFEKTPNWANEVIVISNIHMMMIVFFMRVLHFYLILKCKFQIRNDNSQTSVVV